MRSVIISLVIVAILLLSMAGLWVWVITSADPLSLPITTAIPWPIACTTRGCITTMNWNHYVSVRQDFASATKEDTPNAITALSTLLRQHVTHYAQLRSPVTLADAERYRVDILNLKIEGDVNKLTGLSIDEYDKYIVLPFLEQESLRQFRRAETNDDLYAQLAKERKVVLFLWQYKWDREKGIIVKK